MKTLFAFLLSFVFSLNAAYAGVAAVCDAADHIPQGEVESHIHLGHHSHGTSGDTAETSSNGDKDPVKASKVASDHCHAHGTSSSMVAGSDIVLPPLVGQHILAAFPAAAPASTTPDRLERPPRASLA